MAKFALQDFHLALLLAPLAYLAGGLRQARRAFLPASVLLGLWVCYVVWVGGDVFPLSRFWAPIIPMLAVCTVFLLCAHWKDFAHKTAPAARGDFRRKAGLRMLLALLVVQALLGLVRVHSVLDVSVGGARNGVRYAVALERLPVPQGTIIGVFLAGTTPYFMPHAQFHDFLGKCDTHIAHSAAHWGPPGHNKWDFAYSLGMVRPQYVITDGPYPAVGSAETDALMRQWVSARRDFGFHPSLWLDPVFRRDYVQTSVTTDGSPVQGLSLYVRKAP